MLCRNLVVAERQADISQPQGGWFGAVMNLCPERTMESVAFPVSLQDTGTQLQFPATSWLANFPRRFATKKRFLRSTSNIQHPMPRTGATPVPRGKMTSKALLENWVNSWPSKCRGWCQHDFSYGNGRHRVGRVRDGELNGALGEGCVDERHWVVCRSR